jgi:hypothetical protein
MRLKNIADPIRIYRLNVSAPAEQTKRILQLAAVSRGGVAIGRTNACDMARISQSRRPLDKISPTGS